MHWRNIQPKDRNRIQELHEEWFPVSYQQEFYDGLVHERMPHTNEPLYTCVATVNNLKENESTTTTDNFYKRQTTTTRDDRNMALHVDNDPNDASSDSGF